MLGTLSGELLRLAAVQHPRIIRPAVQAAKKSIDEQFLSEPIKAATARVYLTMHLLEHAPAFGLVEFEEIEAASQDFDSRLVSLLRVFAMNAYDEVERPIPALRQARLIADDATIPETLRAGAFFVLASYATATTEKLSYLEKAEALLKQGGVTSASPGIAMMRFMYGNHGPLRDFVLANPVMIPDRGWAACGTVAATKLLSNSELAKPDVERFLVKAMGVFDTVGPHQVDDLVCFASAVREEFPDMALQAATHAEAAAAREETPDPERVRMTRLCRAKLLRLLNRHDELAGYQDLDTSEVLVIRWRFEYDLVHAIVEPGK